MYKYKIGDMTDVVLVLTTWPGGADADAVAHSLVEAKLAACVVVGPPVRSTYHWQGAVESATERPVTIKTTVERVAALEAALLRVHPYDVPEFLVVPVTAGGEDYLAWVRATTAE